MKRLKLSRYLTKRNKILIGGLIGIAVCGAFPPWFNVLDIPYHAHQRTPAGHQFILMPPESKGGLWGVQIDLDTLFVEWVCVAALTGIATFIFDKSAKPFQPPNSLN